jgi:ABC-2 type transport system permease protein
MLTFSNVRKSYGTLVAVDGLSLSIRKGELFGLLGPNGAGKSTSVSLSLGLLAPDSGTVVIEGHGNPSDPHVRQKIGVAKDVRRDRLGPDNAFDITFPQGVIWGLIGCMMSFGISMVTERTHGTLVRLGMAPLTRAQILGGKALSCFVSILIVELMLLALAWNFGVRPTSFPLLALAGVSAAICFVGFMMLVAGLGKTEETASGAAWAFLMPLSMFGGAMIPTFVMPQWMQTVGYLSPIRWAVLAIEGGVWRNFSIGEMAMPCAILLTTGLVCFAIGTRGLKEA